MKHSVDDLIARAYEYFPRGIPLDDPRYGESPELLRQRAARIPVSAQYDSWRDMLERLQGRFPAEQFPGIHVENHCYYLQDATAGTPWNRCFTGQIWFPPRADGEKQHQLELLVSFVVPYYILYAVSILLPTHAPPFERIKRSFDLPAADLPFAAAIAQEIEATFPGFEPISPQVGLTVVPEVQAGKQPYGEATILSCLFSDSW